MRLPNATFPPFSKGREGREAFPYNNFLCAKVFLKIHGFLICW